MKFPSFLKTRPNFANPVKLRQFRIPNHLFHCLISFQQRNSIFHLTSITININLSRYLPGANSTTKTLDHDLKPAQSQSQKHLNKVTMKLILILILIFLMLILLILNEYHNFFIVFIAHFEQVNRRLFTLNLKKPNHQYHLTSIIIYINISVTIYKCKFDSKNTRS